MHGIDVAYSIFSRRLVFSIQENAEVRFWVVDCARMEAKRVVETIFSQSYVSTWFLLEIARTLLVLPLSEVPTIRDIRVSKVKDLVALDMYDMPMWLKISIWSPRVCCAYIVRFCVEF